MDWCWVRMGVEPVTRWCRALQFSVRASNDPGSAEARPVHHITMGGRLGAGFSGVAAGLGGDGFGVLVRLHGLGFAGADS